VFPHHTIEVPEVRVSHQIKGRTADDLGIFVDVIALKALDKDGNKLFKLDDKKTLYNSASTDVIAKVAQQMLNDVDLDEAEKK
jgi:signal transduction histidine kinase